MNIKTVKSQYSEIETVIFYTETKKEDYFFVHHLSITEDMPENTDVLQAKLYKKLPDTTLVSDRKCLLNFITVKVKRS